MSLFSMAEREKRTISPIKLWDNIISSQLLKNDSKSCLLRQAPYYLDMQGFYSDSDNVTFMYTIDGYPSELEYSFRTTLRRECRAEVRMSFISTFEKHQIPWDSKMMISKLRTWKRLEEDEDAVDEYNMHSKLKLLESQQWRRQSLLYLNDAEIRRKRKTFRFRSVLLISGKRGDNFNDTVKNVLSVSKIIGVRLTRVSLNVQDYLSVFSPFSLEYNPAVLKNVGNNVITDELLARMSTYSQGSVGKDGLVWGSDIYSCFPCFKPILKNTDTAENWLITGESGSGKSFLGTFLIIQLLASKYCNGTIMDIDGFQYLPLGYYVANQDLVSILNMSEGTGAYLDPVEIILTGNKELDRDMYGISTSFTLSIYKTLIGEASSDEWVDIVVNDAVSLTYSQAGVTDDMETWSLSKGYTLFNVYSTLKSLLTNGNIERAISSKFQHSLYEERVGIGSSLSSNDVNRLVSMNDKYQQAVELVIAKVSRYFEESGTRSSFFKNKINVHDLINSKLVICSFGMAGKTEKTVDSVQMALMQLYAANISHLRSIFSKNEGKFNFKVWEEFQRWGNFPDSDKTITTALTGGRKLGDINIILTNKIADMLHHDRFGILSNTTSLAIGAVGDAVVREELCKRLSIEEMLPELDLIAKKNRSLNLYVDGDSIESNPFKKAFLIGLDKTVYTISRVILPAGLARSSIFNSGFSIENEQ